MQSLLAPLEVDWERLLAATPVTELEQRLDAHIAGLAEPRLATLTQRLLGRESDIGHALWPRSSPRWLMAGCRRGLSG